MKKTKWIHKDDLWRELNFLLNEVMDKNCPMNKKYNIEESLKYTDKLINKLYNDEENDNNGGNIA